MRPIFVRSELMDAYRIEQSADKKTLKVSLKKPQHQLINEAGNALPAPYPRAWSWAVRCWTCRTTSARSAARYNEILAAELPGRRGGRRRGEVGKPAREAGRRPDAVHQRHPYRYLGDCRASERGYVPFSPGGDRAQWLRRQQGPGDPPRRRHAQGPPGSRPNRPWSAAATWSGTCWLPRHVRAEPCHRPRRGGRQDLVAGPDQPVFAPGRIMPDIQQRWALVLGADGKGAARRDSPGSARRHPARDPQRALHP